LRFDEAVALRERELDLYRSILQRDPRDSVALERSMYARRFLAGLRLARGELQAATSEIDQANRMADTQLQLEPDNTEWRQAAAKSRQIRADILHWQDKPQQALLALERAKPLVTGLLARDPNIWAWRVELQEGQAQVESDVLRQLGQREAALRIAKASVGRLQRVVQDPAQRTKAERWLIPALGRVARLSSEDGDERAARGAWQPLTRIGSRHAALDADGLLWLARAHAALGEIAASRQLQQRLREANYRHPDFHGMSVATADVPPRKETRP
jgi:tetratricopeptide (TPR) repeat protein